MTDGEFVDEAYRLALRREPDVDGRASALARLAAGEVSRATLVAELVSSPEFTRLRALDDAVAYAAWARAANERPRELRAPAGVDERAIEIAWVLSRYRGEPRVLDIGYANAEPAYLEALVAAAPAPPTGVDLADGDVAGIRGVRGDLRDLPFDDGAFDVVFCVSTLEHVGADNRVYGVGAELRGGIDDALRELRRVAAQRVLITVPCGANEDYGWFVQRAPADWLGAFEVAGFAVHEHETYVHAGDGWRCGDGSTARYGDFAGAVLCAELRPGGLGGRLRRLARR